MISLQRHILYSLSLFNIAYCLSSLGVIVLPISSDFLVYFPVLGRSTIAFKLELIFGIANVFFGLIFVCIIHLKPCHVVGLCQVMEEQA